MLDLAVVALLLLGITPTVLCAVWLTCRFLALCRKWGEHVRQQDAMSRIPDRPAPAAKLPPPYSSHPPNHVALLRHPGNGRREES